MQITVYDTSHGGDEVELDVNVIDNDSFNDVYESTETSITYEGVTYTINKSQSSQTRYIYIRNNNNDIASFDAFAGLLEAMGFVGVISTTDCLEQIFSDTTGTNNYHKDTSASSQPYFTYKKYYHSDRYWFETSFTGSDSSNFAYGDDYNGNLTYGKITCYQASGTLSFFGLIVLNSDPINHYMEATICRTSAISSTNYVEPEASPGDKGFKPVGYITKHNRGGGSRSGEKPGYNTDTLTQPDEPDESVASIAGTGFITVYDITRANLDNVGKALYGETLLTFLDNLFVNPLDFIISLNIFPYTPHIGSSTAIKLGRWECSNAVPNGLGVVANGFPLSKQFRQIDFGTLNVAEMFQSYLDYDASSFSLYLPFIGEVDIPVSEIMGGSINVKYTIDFFTGACVANVLCTKTINIDGINAVSQYAQHSYQGNCAIQIPVTHVSYGNLVGSLINAAAAGLKGGVAGAAFSLAGDAAGGGFKPTVQTKGAITANGGYCAILYPYITVIRPITAEPENYQEVMGYPSYMDATLATCQGLCVCDDINLSGLSGATDSEISRIKQMCKEGIYI